VSTDLSAIRRALAIYAHPDDTETSAGGTLARLVRQGTQVQVVIGARGQKGSSDPDADRDALAARRREEAEAAAAVLGVTSVTFLDVPDGHLDARNADLQRELVRAVRAVKPDAVFAPDPTAVFFGDSYVNHRDHRAIGWAVLDAVAPAAANPHYFPELSAAGLAAHGVADLYLSGTLDPNTYVDISAELEQKIDAVFCHRSQLGAADDAFREFLRSRAEEAGRPAGLAAAEAFRRVTLHG